MTDVDLRKGRDDEVLEMLMANPKVINTKVEKMDLTKNKYIKYIYIYPSLCIYAAALM